jgi:hypothetical protein
MDLYKICPTCNTKNIASEMLCTVCMADISAVLPKEAGADFKAETGSDKTILESTPLFLNFHNGMQKQIQNGDIIGRNLLGSDVLQEYKTISRKHARFTSENGRWFVEDLGSSNGVYIDNLKIDPNTPVEIKNNQKLAISKSFEIKILIK